MSLMCVNWSWPLHIDSWCREWWWHKGCICDWWRDGSTGSYWISQAPMQPQNCWPSSYFVSSGRISPYGKDESWNGPIKGGAKCVRVSGYCQKEAWFVGAVFFFITRAKWLQVYRSLHVHNHMCVYKAAKECATTLASKYKFIYMYVKWVIYLRC